MQKLLIFFILTSLISTAAFAQFTLEQLISGEVTIEELVESNSNINALISEFENRSGLSKSTIHQFLKNKKNRQKLQELKEKEKEVRKLARKKALPKRNKHFFGNPENAENASKRDLEFYDLMMTQAKALYETRKINSSTHNISLVVIDTLRFFHAHNRSIAEEYSMDTESETYGNRISIHTAEKDVPFELRASILFDILKKAYLFADQNGLLEEFFTDGLGRTSGCLEARFSALSQWHENRHKYLVSINTLSEKERAHRLQDTAKNTVSKVIEKNFEDYSNLVYQKRSRAVLASEISNLFTGMYDSSGNFITSTLVNQTLKEIYLISSPSSSPSPKRKSAPHQSINLNEAPRDLLPLSFDSPENIIFEESDTQSSEDLSESFHSI